MVWAFLCVSCKTRLANPTANSAVPLCVCRGLCSSCLPALVVVWTVIMIRSHFLLFTVSLPFYGHELTALQSVTHCLYALSLK